MINEDEAEKFSLRMEVGLDHLITARDYVNDLICEIEDGSCGDEDNSISDYDRADGRELAMLQELASSLLDGIDEVDRFFN